MSANKIVNSITSTLTVRTMSFAENIKVSTVIKIAPRPNCIPITALESTPLSFFANKLQNAVVAQPSSQTIIPKLPLRIEPE